MRKIFAVSCLFVLLLYGCQSSTSPSPDEVEKMTLSQERRIGVLQSLGGAFTSSQATHLLRMEDGKTLYLKSSALDLSNVKYTGKNVEVMGEILRTTDGNQIMTVSNIDVLDTEATPNQELPQWVDYQSENLKTSFKYRDDYAVKEENNQIIVTKKPVLPEVTNVSSAMPATASKPETTVAPTNIIIAKVAESEDGMVKAMNVNSLTPGDVLAGGYNRSKITQKAIDAYKKSSSDNKNIDYYLMAGGWAYKISFSAGDDTTDLTDEQNMFYDILASIDFAGSAAAAKSPDLTNQGPADNNSVNSDQPAETKPANTAAAVAGNTGTSSANSEDSTISADSMSNTISGFDIFKSDSQKFSIAYPKSYYFGSVSPTSSDALHSYQFGSQPLEESPGEIVLDIVKGTMPSGKNVEYQGKQMVLVNDGDKVNVYTEFSGKLFRLSAASSKSGLLQQMASTMQ